MKITSIQGIIAIVIVYALIDRGLNMTQYYSSKAAASFDVSKRGLGFDFSAESIGILVGSVLIVRYLPKIF